MRTSNGNPIEGVGSFNTISLGFTFFSFRGHKPKVELHYICNENAIIFFHVNTTIVSAFLPMMSKRRYAACVRVCPRK